MGNMEWLLIEDAPDGSTKEMFLVRAFNVMNGFTGGEYYTSDPWCVWREKDGSFARWPHHFPPTHWCRLPVEPSNT